MDTKFINLTLESNNKKLEIGKGKPYRLLSIEGIESSEFELFIKENVFYDGSAVDQRRIKGRSIMVEAEFIGLDKKKERRKLINFFNLHHDGKLTINYMGLELVANYTIESFKSPLKNLNNPLKFLVYLFCPNPFLQEKSSTETSLATWIPNLEFPVNEGFYTEQTPNYWLESRIKQQYLEIYPSGTVYWEPVVKDKAVYNNGIAVELPINELESVTVNGVNIPLDTVTVAQDGLSFTSNSIADGDIVEYVYWYPKELTTMPTMQVGKYVIEGGIGSLPSDANGQVSSVELKGRTYTQLFEIDQNDWRNSLTKLVEDSENSTINQNSIYFNGNAGYRDRINIPVANLQKNKKYGMLFYVDSYLDSYKYLQIWNLVYNSEVNSNYINISINGEPGYRKAIIDTTNLLNNYQFNILVRDAEVSVYDLRLIELNTQEAIEEFDNLSAEELAQKYPYINGTKSTIGAMRLKSVSADETETSTAYVVAKDSEGKIAELRSLPNGVKDEIDVTHGKAIKRTKKVNLWELNWIIHSDSHTENFYGLRVNPYFSDAIVQDTSSWTLKNYNGDKTTKWIDGFVNTDGYVSFMQSDWGNFHIKIPKAEIDGDITTAKAQAWFEQNQVQLIYQLAEPEIILLPPEIENPFEGFLSEFGTGTPVEFGYREINQIVEIDNTGDVDCPIKVVFRASGDVVKPYIQNVETRELLRINKTLKMGDVLEITTEFGNKNVYLNGEKAHHYLDFLNSTWLQLSPGINLIKYDAEHGLTNLECSIYHTPQYLGV